MRPVRYPREYEFKNELVRSVFSGGWDFLLRCSWSSRDGALEADMVAYYAYGLCSCLEL